MEAPPLRGSAPFSAALGFKNMKKLILLLIFIPNLAIASDDQSAAHIKLMKGVCFVEGKLHKIIADDYFSGVSEKDLKMTFNAPGHIAIIDELVKDHYQTPEGFAASIYYNCLAKSNYQAAFDRESAEICYRNLRLYDQVVQMKDNGISEGNAHKIMSDGVTSDKNVQKELDQAVTLIYSTTNKQEEVGVMHLFFTTCKDIVTQHLEKAS